MSRLIGITGRAGAGKDEAAKALVSLGWKREAFADKMREAMLALDPFVPRAVEDHETRLSHLVEHYGWDTAKREFGEVRRLLQRFGTEAGRNIHGDNCWIDLVLKPWLHCDDAYDEYDLVVPDVRFKNEAKAVLDLGGMVVRIDRPDLAPLAGAEGSHASEVGLPDDLVGWVIVNNGTVEQLHNRIQFLAETGHL